MNLNQKKAIGLLRISLGIVFIWFGALKVFGVSPVVGMVQTLYPQFPYPAFLIFLGAWEALIGLGFIFNKYIRWAIYLMWLQMAGIFAGLLFVPHLFFNVSNPLILTQDGEFVIKNLVLIAASLVVLLGE